MVCGVQTHYGEVNAFQCGLLVREMTAGSDGFPDPGVHGFDRIGRADDAADLCIELQERHVLGPSCIPTS